MSAQETTEKNCILVFTDVEVQTIWRSLIEYKRILDLSAVRDADLVQPEQERVAHVLDVVSLSFFYPEIRPEGH